MKKGIIGLLVLVMGCSSVELVHSWKNPDIVIFDANKVLVVGMTQNEEARELFETRMVRLFNKRDVEATRSIDLFDVNFTSAARSEEEMDQVEALLLDRDFDAILFTKVLGSENRTIFMEKMTDLEGYERGFSEDYLKHQDIYYDERYYEDYTVYHAETALYCICIGKDRELIWKGALDITDPIDIKSTVDDYIKMVEFALEEEDLIFHAEKEEPAL